MDLDALIQLLLKAVPTVATVVVVVVALWLAHRLLERGPKVFAEHRFRIHMMMLALTALGILIVIMVVPMGDARRGQLLSLIGILLSAAIALSSTTFLGNVMAGIMLRAVGNFRSGDFITCDGQFGRVTERGLFHTEIQTEERTLTTLPNMVLVTNPTTVVRSSGTIVSATVSLGYDAPRADVEAALLDAASRAELTDPFVQVRELGDFSVSYRVAGLLVDVKTLLTVRSRLRASMLDALHGAGIEIVSPTFMNTRALDPITRVLPGRARVRPPDPSSAPESIVFDKADEAETIEKLRAELKAVLGELEALEAERGRSAKDAPAADEAHPRRAELDERRARLVEELEQREQAHREETADRDDSAPPD